MPCPTPATDTASPLLRIITPMSADAFDSILAATNLTYKYPKLASKIRNGFPIGDPDPPDKTTILENHLHHPNDSEAIREYLDAETAKGHMTGPFTKEEMDNAVGGVTWVASPVMVVRTPGDHGGPEKTRVVINSSKKNEDGISVNDQLHCDDTTWGTAADVAEIVSVHFIYLFPYHICVDLFDSGRVKPRGCTSNFFETVEGLKVVAAKDVVPGSSVARDWYISSHLLLMRPQCQIIVEL